MVSHYGSYRSLQHILSLKDSILFEILFLGTSASAPSAKRGLSAQIVKHDEYRFLIDCGEGTQRQILQSSDLAEIALGHVVVYQNRVAVGIDVDL